MTKANFIASLCDGDTQALLRSILGGGMTNRNFVTVGTLVMLGEEDKPCN